MKRGSLNWKSKVKVQSSNISFARGLFHPKSIGSSSIKMSDQAPEPKRPCLDGGTPNGSSVRPKVAFLTGVTGQVSQ